MGITINKNGFITICNSEQTESFYGRGECSAIRGFLSPANLQGNESIAIIWGHPNGNFLTIDIFGIPGTVNPIDQNFRNGRAVRKINIWQPYNYFDINNWHVFPGGAKCTQEVGPEGMDINVWQDVTGPICGMPTVLITEIIDLDVDSTSGVVPRFVELHAPWMKDRGQRYVSNLKLVIFHGAIEEPHWSSAVPIHYMPESGFLVVCNSAAFEAYGDECSKVSGDLAGPANSNGNDQIAIISGDESSWFVVDIYGVIGEPGHDSEHDFFNSRVIRKLDVRTTQADWSRYDWVLCPSGNPDPNEWESESCITDDSPSLVPTSDPTPESQNDCEFFFTELANCGLNEAYIEIMTNCPVGAKISRDLVVVSWKEYDISCELDLTCDST